MPNSNNLAYARLEFHYAEHNFYLKVQQEGGGTTFAVGTHGV